MAVPCRCSNRACRARRTLKRHPDTYVRVPLCHSCKKGKMRPATYRSSGRERTAAEKRRCHCGGVYMQRGLTFHQRGTRGCIHDPKNVDPHEGGDGLDPPF